MKDSYFKKVMSEGSVLLSISLLNMRGHRSGQMGICTSTAYGYQEDIKGKGTQTYLWISVSKTAKRKGKKGFVLYHTSQCPFTAKYVPLFEEMAEKRGVDLHVVHIQSREGAQNAPSPFTTYSLFYDGGFVTHEILSEKKFEKILVSKGM